MIAHKHYILSVVLVFLINTYAFTQICKIGDIIIKNQDDLENFKTTYGLCHQIEGNLTIRNGLIDSSFNNIHFLDGNLTIEGFNHETLTGFADIKTITQNLYVKNGWKDFKKLNAFNQLEDVGNNLSISNNNNLQEISGFNALKNLGRYLTIEQNGDLSNISGFNDVSYIYYFDMNFTPKISSVNGFKKLDSISILNLSSIGPSQSLGNISSQSRIEYLILNSTALKTLHELDSIQISALRIENNFHLETLEGLEYISELQSLTIKNNPKITQLTGLDNLQKVGVPKLGVNTVPKIEIAWNENLTTTSALNNLDSIITRGDDSKPFLGIEYNKSLKLIELDDLKYINGDIKIKHNDSLRSVRGFNRLEVINGNLNISSRKIDSIRRLL